jgi:transposase InsO family protein
VRTPPQALRAGDTPYFGVTRLLPPPDRLAGRAEREAEEKRGRKSGQWPRPVPSTTSCGPRWRRINRRRVARLIHVHHIAGRHLRGRKRTMVADRTVPPAPDLMNRDFTAKALNTRRCGDVTYLAVAAT